MTVDFFQTNEQNTPITEFYLFSKEMSCVINGQYIENDEKFYLIIGQLVADEKNAPHKVFVYQVNK
ncbi:MAG: hypothetical protein K0M50_17525 [Prolixibacteraceae bacterium]|nr:hypothetical protein [Prolixibacteraceae bacterium]